MDNCASSRQFFFLYLFCYKKLASRWMDDVNDVNDANDANDVNDERCENGERCE